MEGPRTFSPLTIIGLAHMAGDHVEWPKRLRDRLAGTDHALIITSRAALDVLAERARHTAEGWTPEHDDEHDDSEMALAAAAYAVSNRSRNGVALWAHLWPWSANWWKPKSRRADLVRAGSLIIAEIERLDRAAAKTGEAA